MKSFLKSPLFLTALIAAFSLIAAAPLTAQTLTTLCSFTNGSDGSNPYGNPYGLVLSSNTLFGATTYGGIPGNGTVFAIGINGAGFTNVYTFTAVDTNAGTNLDGAQPNGVILSGNTLYGTTTSGGTAANGTVFSVNTNGTGFKTLHNFTALDAATATTNSDGAQPYAGVTLSGNILYGTGTYGGSAGNGTVFALTTNGTGFTNLHNFTALDAATETSNSDGAFPNGLVLSGKTLYGTANGGGAFGSGTIFAVNTNGAGFATFYDFTATNDVTGFNSDGAFPIVGLTLQSNTLYGTAPEGGAAGNGTIFAINTNGAGFTSLYSFTALYAATQTTNSDGAIPQAGVIVSGATVYGTAYYGGSSGDGTVFKLTPSVSLSIQASSTQAILSWPDPTFSLQSAPEAGGTYVTVSNAASPYTNSLTGARQFFRLIGN